MSADVIQPTVALRQFLCQKHEGCKLDSVDTSRY